jgi:hypothetical protein
VQSGERFDAAAERQLGSRVTNRYGGEFRRVRSLEMKIREVAPLT